MAFLCRLVAWAFAGSSCFVCLQQLPAHEPFQMIDVPDTEGSLLVTGTGNRTGSTFQIRYRFEGFYLFSQPVLTLAEQPDSQLSSDEIHDLADYTYLFPKFTTLSVDGRLHGVHSHEGGTPGADSFSELMNEFSVSDSYQLPVLPKRTPVVAPLYQGHGPGITIADRSRVGRGTTLHFDATSTRWMVATAKRNALLAKAMHGDDTPPPKSLFWRADERISKHFNDGVYTSTTVEDLPIGYSVNLGGSSILSLPTTRLSRITATGYGINLSIVDGRAIQADAFNGIDQLKYQGVRTLTAETDNDLNTIIDGDSAYSIRLDYRIGIPLGDVILRPKEQDEEQFLPDPGWDLPRRYTVELKDIAPSDVDAIRVRLKQVSRHVGIATNAGNHVRGVERGSCRDCGQPVSMTPHSVSCEVAGQHLSRQYDGYDRCPIDTLPDVLFRLEGDNEKDWDLEDPIDGTGLQYKIGHVLICENVDRNEFEVNVRILDGAASAQLSVEAKINGVWIPGIAEGVSANSTGDYLMLPIDTNGNGIGDSWAGDGLANDSDNEGSLRSAVQGDGLTNFEEYRSVFSRGMFYSTRLNPHHREVFVHDYSLGFASQLNSVKSWYEKQNLSLIQLKDFETRDERVNWQDSRFKRGDQYAIIVMDSTDPLLASVSSDTGTDWSRVGGQATLGERICPQANTAIIGAARNDAERFARQHSMNEDVSRTLAHEIGHVMGCKHHGEGDYWDEVDGQRVLVAVQGGNHSGDAGCFMRYQQADKFRIPDSVAGVLADYPEDLHKRDHFCEGRRGTGINGGGWCGDATNGRCLHQIRLRSS
ncbi:hypothetical protein TBK1r_22490 [Stieleria magnilauensis]|uniref:Peptidase M12B domain-containing protein n=2 Tax=Stieleria magnilauensis TaxID=2527963 RepID=A0ABX5XNQ5_9BACT|nr:hypothetical protein TBK1r_22490 [Planctomycetes bacterium TBK1r]